MKFLDASLNWNDWNAFLAGDGTIYVQEKNGLGITLNGKSGAGKGARQAAPIEFLGDVLLSMSTTGTSATMHVASRALVRVNGDIVHNWNEVLADFFLSNNITEDPDIWPLLSIVPTPTYDAWVWSIVKDPANRRLAGDLFKKRKNKRSYTLCMDVAGVMPINTKTEYHT